MKNIKAAGIILLNPLTLFLLLIIIMMQTINSQTVKKAFINGKIYTVDEKNPFARIVVTEGNKITFAGSETEAAKYIDDSTQIIDLGEKLMLPGFIDNHVHFIDGGFYLSGIDLRNAASMAEFKEILKSYVSKHKGKWITGGNWDHEKWDIKNLPSRTMVDSFTAETPVFVERLDGHMGLANSYALRLAGITKETENPEGGLIEKDPLSGEPTGILKDNAMNLVYKVIPPRSEEEIYDAAITAMAEAKKSGITSVQDITSPEALKVYEKMEKENKLTCRIFTRYPLARYKDLVVKGIRAGSGNEILKTGSLKAYADGSLGSSTAWFFEPYLSSPSGVGLPSAVVTGGELEEFAIDADLSGLQLSIHAIGDHANAWVLDLFRKIKEENPPWDRRFRIEHAQHVVFDDILRFRETGVIPSAQPYHCIDDGVWAEKRIGKERLKYSYPFAAFLDLKINLCFGTDWPVAPLNPLLGIYAAVTRRTLDEKNPGGWIPEQKITVHEAIKCYTLNNAYASFEENIKGSIEAGKLADMVVLSEDILVIDPVKIKDVKIEMTIFNGEIIYQKQ